MCFPSDLNEAILAAKLSKQMYRDSPALLAIDLRGKDGPFKQFLREEWTSLRSGVQSCGVQPQLVHKCLQKVIRRMARRGVMKTLDLWAHHIGKNVSHHSGWLSACQKMNVLQKVANDASGSGVLVLGKDRQRYKLLPYSAELFDRAFKRHEQLGAILQKMPTPKSTSEWIAAITSATADADQRKFPRKSSSYLWSWMLRSNMIVQSRTRGIHAMTIDKSFRCSELESMAPDQKKHINMLKDDTTFALDLFNVLGYNGPPELFSMYTCIFLAKGSEAWEAVWVSDRVDRLIALREDMHRREGIQPHPLNLLQEFWNTNSCVL